MEPFVELESKAVPLLVDNVDTDVITPIGRVLQGGSALVEFAFEPLRFDASGRIRTDCPLNDGRYAGAQILIAGDNFACGSSRETAVWAVRGLGFRCVIAPSFGDIFHSNCFKNGVLPVTLEARDVAELASFAEGGVNLVSVDLGAQRIRAGERSFAFDVPALRKEALLAGLDDLGLILRRRDAIARFEQADRIARPWAHLEPGQTFRLQN